jgi:hypothetical protein
VAGDHAFTRRVAFVNEPGTRSVLSAHEDQPAVLEQRSVHAALLAARWSRERLLSGRRIEQDRVHRVVAVEDATIGQHHADVGRIECLGQRVADDVPLARVRLGRKPEVAVRTGGRHHDIALRVGATTRGTSEAEGTGQ